MKRFISLFLALLLSLGAAAPLVHAYSVPSDTIVYVTDKGTKYHRSGCSYLTSSHALTIEEAERQGYGPCSRCDPDRKVGAYGAKENDSSSSGSSGGETTPNYPDKYEPYIQAKRSVSPSTEKGATDMLASGTFWSIAIASCIIMAGFFVPGLLIEKARGKQLRENAKLQPTIDAAKKVAQLKDLLSKGYCTNPYTGLPMRSIDDFIAYVEKLNHDFEAQQAKHK